jgi:hypothetical protein
MTLRVASFNVFYGGDEMVLATRDCTDPLAAGDLRRRRGRVKESKADVVGWRRPATRKVAEALGWNYNERTQVISRFRIVDPVAPTGSTSSSS